MTEPADIWLRQQRILGWGPGRPAEPPCSTPECDRPEGHTGAHMHIAEDGRLNEVAP